MYWSSFFEQKHKRQFIQIPFSLADVHAKNVTHLKEVARDFELCEFIQAPTVRGFNPKGVFTAHLNSIGYSNLTKIFIPLENEGNPRNPKTIINANVKSKKLKQSKPETRQRPKCESPSQVGSQSYYPICPSSSNIRVSYRKYATGGESKEGCSRDNDREDPPWDRVDKSHVNDPPRKRRKSHKSSKEDEIFQDLNGMEVDTYE